MKKKPKPLRIAKVFKEHATYVIKVYDTKGRLWDFFDSSTLEPAAALEFVLLAVRTRSSKVEKIEFAEDCEDLEALWKKALRS